MYKKSSLSWMKHLDFTLWDLAVLLVSYYLANFLRFGIHLNIFTQHMTLQIGVTLLLIYFCVAMFTNAYKNILRRNRYQEANAVLLQICITFAVQIVYLYVTQQAFPFSRMVTFLSAMIATVLIYGERIVWKHIIRVHMLNNENLPHMLVIADKAMAERCLKAIHKRRYNVFYISGVIITDKDMKGQTIAHHKVVCNADEIKCYVLSRVVDEVFISMEDRKHQDKLVSYFLEMGITVHIGLISSSIDLPNKMIEKIGGQYVLTTSNNTTHGINLMLKRLMDIIGGLIGLLITGILFLFIAPKIKKADPGPVFFSQERVGKNGRIFKIYKFRSMYMDAEERKKELMKNNEMDGLMFKMENDPRILPGIGHRIRDWSLDEFPQFWNVLKGDMSLVGTRPPTLDEFKQYDAHHKMRLSFKPGLTGLWQVSGRSSIKDFEEIVRMDNDYIKNWSLRLDIRIIFKTIGVVLRRKGSM